MMSEFIQEINWSPLWISLKQARWLLPSRSFWESGAPENNENEACDQSSI